MQLTDVSSQNKPRSVYVQQPWPSKDDKQCKVYVTYIKTPSCFCVQLISNTTTKALEALQEDMTAFFNSKDGNGYAIKEPYIGQVSWAREEQSSEVKIQGLQHRGLAMYNVQ